MASFHNLSIPDLLRETLDFYTNARDDAEVFAVLSDEPWTFTAADFDAGLALRQAVVDAQEDEAEEILESREATAAHGAAVGAVETTYLRHRGRLRRAHPRGTPAYSALSLAGDAPADREDLLKDAFDFYAALAARPDLVAGVRGVTEATVAEAQALIGAARTAGTTQTKEAGDVERISGDRQRAIEALREHAAMTSADVKEALADHPQLRERLGLLERS